MTILSDIYNIFTSFLLKHTSPNPLQGKCVSAVAQYEMGTSFRTETSANALRIHIIIGMKSAIMTKVNIRAKRKSWMQSVILCCESEWFQCIFFVVGGNPVDRRGSECMLFHLHLLK